MRLASPYFLGLLILLPFFWYWLRQRGVASAHNNALAFPSTQLLQEFASFKSRARKVLPLLRWLALLLCILALTRPQWGIEATKIVREGIAIAMVVDISSSMAAEDLQLDEKKSNRLEVVKHTFKSFVTGDSDNANSSADLQGREGDMIGMFTFARYTEALSPLTLDHAAVLDMLEQVKLVPLPEEDGTAIGDAIVMGVEGLRRGGSVSKVMILLTDGTNNAGDTAPLQAAQIAKALGIKIYTIGTGTRGIAMMPARLRGGGFELRPTPVYIDEDSLTDVAELTGGKYYRATDSETLAAIYAEIDRLEKGENVIESYQQYVEMFPPLLFAALALLLLEILLSTTFLRTVP